MVLLEYRLSMTTQEVERKLADKNIPWERFQTWMNGQTVSGYPDGSTNWYEYDVDRFIRHTLKDTKENSVEWD